MGAMFSHSVTVGSLAAVQVRFKTVWCTLDTDTGACAEVKQRQSNCGSLAPARGILTFLSPLVTVCTHRNVTRR